jgi:hypothetical protein
MAPAFLSISLGQFGMCRDSLRAFLLAANLRTGHAAVRIVNVMTGQLRSGGDWGLESVDPAAGADQIAAYLAQYIHDPGLEARVTLSP